MFKKILCGFLIVIGIGFISAYVRGYVYQSNITNEKTTYKEIKENEKQTLIEEDTISEILNTEDTTSTEEVKKNSNNTTPKVVEEKQTYNNNQTNNTKVEEKKEEQPKVVEKTPTTAWEDLGITEYEYYNSPMWSWDRVDFKVSDYGSQSATELACRNKGQEYYDQGFGFSCTNVNSYSGAYLGERLETF